MSNGSEREPIQKMKVGDCSQETNPATLNGLLVVTEKDGPGVYKADTCATSMWDVRR
jgi:hypothetical protein